MEPFDELSHGHQLTGVEDLPQVPRILLGCPVWVLGEPVSRWAADVVLWCQTREGARTHLDCPGKILGDRVSGQGAAA